MYGTFNRVYRVGSGDPKIWGPNWVGTICPGGPNFWGPFVQGTKFLGTICPWGPFVQRDQFYGDHLSRGTVSGGLEVRGSNGFRTKCVAAICFYFNFQGVLMILSSLHSCIFTGATQKKRDPNTKSRERLFQWKCIWFISIQSKNC